MSTDLEQALSRLSKIANEEASGDDIPIHFISKINTPSPKKSKKQHSAYFRNENFSKDKNIKIGNQQRLKFLEELSELREKPNINASLGNKVRFIQLNAPIYLRAAQIIKDRNLSINLKKAENSRKLLDEETSLKKNSSLSPNKTNQVDFLESVRLWQMKKERNIKQQIENKEKNETKDLKFSPTLNEKSLKILKKLKEIQKTPQAVSSVGSIINKKTKSTGQTFHPAISNYSKKLTLTRTASVFERLYTPTTPIKKVAKSKSKSKKKQPSYTSLIEKTYSINAGKGTISDRSQVEEIKFEPSMKFLLEDYFK